MGWNEIDLIKHIAYMCELLNNRLKKNIKIQATRVRVRLRDRNFLNMHDVLGLNLAVQNKQTNKVHSTEYAIKVYLYSIFSKRKLEKKILETSLTVGLRD